MPEHSSVEELHALAELMASEEEVDRRVDLRLGVALQCFKMTIGGCPTFFLKMRTDVPYAVVEPKHSRALENLGPDSIAYQAPDGVWLAVSDNVAPYTASLDAALELAEACGEDPELVLKEALDVELKAPAAVFVSDFARRFLIRFLDRLIIRAGLIESDLNDD